MHNVCRCFLISLALGLLLTTSSVAQGVAVGWSTDDALSAPTQKAAYFALLKANNIDSDRQGIEKYFDNYYFSRWTLPASTGAVRGYSRELLDTDFKELAGGARDYLLNKSFDTLRKMVADQTVTPTARYNAIYTIGQLNQRDAPGTNAPPVPYPQALPYLVKEFERKDGNPDYLRLGALLGILRHSILGINDAELRDTTLPALMTKTIRDGKPTNRGINDQEMLDCFRYRAIETLGALKSTGQRGEIVNLMLELMETIEESTEIRCLAARALSDLNYQAATTAGVQIPYQKVGNALLTLGKAICDIELRRVEDARNKAKVKMGIGPLQPGMADVDPDFTQLPPEAQQEVTNAVQRIKAEFFDIKSGIRGGSDNRFTGPTTAGILPMLASEDPVAVKLTQMTKTISQLFEYLDKGPADKPAPVVQPMGDPLGATPSLRGGGTAPKPNVNALKVNLGLIRERLLTFSEDLDKIIAG